MSPGRYRLVIQPEATRKLPTSFIGTRAKNVGCAGSFCVPFAQRPTHSGATLYLYHRVENEVRRALLRRFPYGVFYEVHGSEIVLLACFHSARDPQEWQDRITRE